MEVCDADYDQKFKVNNLNKVSSFWHMIFHFFQLLLSLIDVAESAKLLLQKVHTVLTVLVSPSLNNFLVVKG